MTTTYQRELKQQILLNHPNCTVDELIDLLYEMGVVDQTRCKVLAVRRWVENQVKKGKGKVDTMYQAAEHFACSYEYVRKCIYYYTDVTLI